MSSLRIISGIARGRKLRSVPGDTTRPITDRAKEALFNVLGADIVGASFLDLFSDLEAWELRRSVEAHHTFYSLILTVYPLKQSGQI